MLLTVNKLHPKEVLKETMDAFKKHSKGKRFIFESKIITKDKKIVPVDINSSTIKINGKKYLQGVFRDITDRKKIEEELKESKERFQQIAKNANEWIWEVDDKAVYTYTNTIVEKILGYKPKELVGKKHPFDLFIPEARKKLKKEMFDIFKKKKSFVKFLNFNVHKNGKTIILETSGGPFFNKKGDFLGYRGADTDITERKMVEEKLQRTLEATTGGIWTWNFKTDKLQFSPRYYQMIGYKPNEFKANFKNWIKLLHPDDKKKAITTAKEYLKKKPDVYENEFRLKTKKGNYIWISTKGKVVERDKMGNAIYMIGNHEDITDRKIIEEKLKESELRYRRLFEAAKDGILIINADTGKIIDVNKYLIDLLGYSHKEFVGKQIWQISPFKNIVENKAKFKKLQKEKFVRYENLPLETKKGKNKNVEFISNVYKVGDLNVVQCNIRDITERKIAEEKSRKKIEESEFRLSIFINSTDQMMFLKDKNLNYLLVNDANAKFFGEKKEKIIGKSDFDFMPKKAAEECRKNDKKVINRKEIIISEESVKDRIYETRKIPVIIDKKVVGVAGIITDITERKKAEQELKESKEKIDLIMEYTDEFFYIHDTNHILSYVGASSKQFFGYSPDEMMIKWTTFVTDNPINKKGLKITEDTIKTGKKHGPYILELEKKDGSKFLAEVNESPVKDNKGKVIAIAGGLRDVTERERSREELEEAYEELKKVDELKSGIIRDVTHEFKNPISKIKLMTHLLGSEFEIGNYDKNKIKKYMDIIENNSDLFLKQITSVLQLSKIESISKIEKSKIDLVQMIEDLIKYNILSIKQKKLDIVKKFDSIGKINANHTFLRIALNNILENAIKFTKKGQIIISVKKLKNKIRISIKDTGIGISKKNLEKIFDVFYQKSKTTKGVGIGLSLAKKIIKLHGGSIKVESQRGKGSNFVIDIPTKKVKNEKK